MVIEEIIVIFILYVLYTKYKTQVNDFVQQILEPGTESGHWWKVDIDLPFYNTYKWAKNLGLRVLNDSLLNQRKKIKNYSFDLCFSAFMNSLLSCRPICFI